MAARVAGIQQPHALGDARGADHADRHRLAVQELLVAPGRLHPVPDGVTVVEEGACARLALILGDDAGLDGRAAGDQLLGGKGGGVAGAGFEEPDELLVEDEAVLDQFGEAVPEVAGRESGEEVGVAEDEEGLGEGAHEVLADDVVDAGLPADGGIDHAEEARGHVDEGDAAKDGGGGVPAEVGHDAAAEADDEVAALDALAEQPVVDGGDGSEGLLLLATGNGHSGDLEAGRAEGVERGGGVQGACAIVGKDEGATGEFDSSAEFPEVGEGALAHDDGVAAAGSADGSGDAGNGVVRAGAIALPEPQHGVAGLLGGEAVDTDGGVGAGVVVAAGFKEPFEASAGVAGEEGAGFVIGLLGEALGGDGRVDGEPDGEAVGQNLTAGVVGGDATASSDDHAGRARRASEGAGFQLAEGGFAMLAEDCGDGLARGLLDQGIGIGERPAEPIGKEASDG